MVKTISQKIQEYRDKIAALRASVPEPPKRPAAKTQHGAWLEKRKAARAVERKPWAKSVKPAPGARQDAKGNWWKKDEKGNWVRV